MQVRDLARRQRRRRPRGARRSPRRRPRPATTGPAEDDGADGVRSTGSRCRCRTSCRSTRAPTRACAAVLAEREFDVAHVHAGVVSPFAFGVVPVAAGAGVPTVVTLHCLWGYLTPAFRLVDRRAHWTRWPVVFSAVSDVAAFPLRRIGGPEIEVDVAAQRHRPVGVGGAAAGARPRRRAGRLGDAARPAQAADAAAADVAGDPRPGPVGDPHPRQGHRRGAGAALAGALPAPHRHGRLGRADRSSRPRRDQGRATSARTCSSPRRTWSRSASRRSRPAAPGLPVLAKANSGIREFVADEREGLLAATDGELVSGLVRLLRSPGLRGARSPSTTARSLRW